MSESAPMTVQQTASLQALNTFQVAVRSRFLARIESESALLKVLSDPVYANEPRLVLGGGSNVLFTGDFPGLILHMGIQGIDVSPVSAGQGSDQAIHEVSVGAGENWDAFVRWSLDQGYEGLENLILIPGSVGAAPMQNIGAYGVEVAEFIHVVRAWDCETERFVELNVDDCAFAYRDSLFKQQRGRFIITRVVFHLPRQHARVLHYSGVSEYLAETGIQHPTARDVANAVVALRQQKLPDPAQQGNAGSFFKNPVVTSAEAADLKDRHPDLPAFASDDGVKLSAAWLLESSGFKGFRRGQAGFSSQHALVLINLGQASGEALWGLAKEAQATVFRQFGIRLDPEPLVL